MKNVIFSKRSLILLLFPLGLILTVVSKISVDFSEWYCINIYGKSASVISRITGVLPFSLFEIFLYAAIISLSVGIGFIIFYSLKKKDGKKTALIVRGILCALAVLYFLVSVFSVGYSRKPFSETMGLDLEETDNSDLYEFCLDLAKELSVLREGMAEDENGVVKTSLSFSETAKECENAMKSLSESVSTLKGNYGRAKSVILSPVMSYMGITGMFSPITYEANINTSVPSFTIPATVCHELAHLRGYAKENEANFISYLACIQSGNDELCYSAKLMAFIYGAEELFLVNKEAFLSVRQELSEKVLRDIIYESNYWLGHEGVSMDISSKVNDVFLKSNGEEMGIRSYSEAVNLFVAYHKSQKN